MAEENLRAIEDRVEGRLDGIENRLSRLEGLFEQMNQRVTSIEQALRQMQGNVDQNHRQLILLVVGTWITTMLTILFKG